MYSVQVV